MAHARTVPLLALVAVSVVLYRDAQAASVLVFPQVVTGGGYISTITLVNTNFNATVTGTLAFFNQDGTPRDVAIDGRPSGTTQLVTITPGATVVLTTSPGGASIVAGMAKFTSDFPAGGVVRFAFSGGQVGVLTAPIRSFSTLLLDTAGGNNTGVAIANPGTESINLRLSYADDAGIVQESVDPPELNPLRSNAQIAKFVDQFGFSSKIANRSSGSIQIINKGTTGGFSAFALLLKDGALSSTAVVPGVSGKMTLADFSQSYSGTWTNTTFNSSGTASLALSVDLTAKLAVINFSLTGNVFGGSAPAPTTLMGTYSLSGFTATGNSPVFGPITMTITAEGNWTFTASSVPSATVSRFSVTGTARPDRITGDYTVTFSAGGTATGTILLNVAS